VFLAILRYFWTLPSIQVSLKQYWVKLSKKCLFKLVDELKVCFQRFWDVYEHSLRFKSIWSSIGMNEDSRACLSLFMVWKSVSSDLRYFWTLPSIQVFSKAALARIEEVRLVYGQKVCFQLFLDVYDNFLQFKSLWSSILQNEDSRACLSLFMVWKSVSSDLRYFWTLSSIQVFSKAALARIEQVKLVYGQKVCFQRFLDIFEHFLLFKSLWSSIG
jgi:hypothetical protein